MDAPDPAVDPVLADFRAAIHKGDAAAVTALLANQPVARAHVNAPMFYFGARPIMAAKQHPAVVDALLAHGADIDLKSDWWAGPWGVLDMADQPTADFLITRGATVDIFAASHLNRLDRAQQLLDADPPLINAKGGDGGRPLHFAVSIEMADLLLERGAELEARDVDHEATPAQWALNRPGESLDVLRHLIARGAAVDPFMAVAVNDVARVAAMMDADPAFLDHQVGGPGVPLCPKAPGEHLYVYRIGRGQTVVDVANMYGATDVAKLIFNRATPRQRLLVACTNADRAAVESMLQADPAAVRSLNPVDHDRVARAAWDGNGAAVQLMLDVGFDPAAPGPDSGTALHCAAWRGRADIVQIVLNHRAFRPELIHLKETTHGSTPLGWCCHGSTNCHDKKGDYPAVARLLLAAGAKPGPNLGDASPEVCAVLAR